MFYAALLLFGGFFSRLVRRNQRTIVGERQNTLARANFHAVAAFYTFVVIDNGEIVAESYRFGRTVTLAFSATYTAFFARADYFFAAAKTGTGDIHRRVGGDPADNAFRTRGHARAARSTQAVVDLCDRAVFTDGNRVVAAGVGATSQSHTAEFASLAAARQNFGGHAIAVTLIFVFVFAEVSAVTMHDRNRLFGIFHREIEYFRDVFFTLLGCRVTFREFCFAFYERFGKSVAPGITAAAAVCSRQVTANVVDARVMLHRHFRTEKR